MKPKVVRLGKNEVAQVGEGKRGQGVKMGTAEIIKPVKGGFKVMPQIKPKVQVYRDPDTNKKYKIGGTMKSVKAKKAAWGANMEGITDKLKPRGNRVATSVPVRAAPKKGEEDRRSKSQLAREAAAKRPAAIRAVPMTDTEAKDALSKRAEKTFSRTAGTIEQKRAAAMAVQTKSQENRQKWKDSQAKLAARRKKMGFKD